MKHIASLTSVVVAACLLTSTAFAADGKPCPTAKQQTAKKQPAATGVARTAKTGMGARISYTVDTPVVGSVGHVRLQVQQPANQQLTITITPDAALSLSGLPGGSVVQSAASADYVLGVLPQGEGLHYLNVFLHSGTMTEALAIPVQVGKTQTIAKPVAVKTMPDGQRVMSIPAQQ